jgi:hypothetical protein
MKEQFAPVIFRAATQEVAVVRGEKGLLMPIPSMGTLAAMGYRLNIDPGSP